MPRFLFFCEGFSLRPLPSLQPTYREQRKVTAETQRNLPSVPSSPKKPSRSLRLCGESLLVALPRCITNAAFVVFMTNFLWGKAEAEKERHASHRDIPE